MQEKIWVQPNVAKVRSNVMLVQSNVTSTITCDVGTAESEDGTIKYEKKWGNYRMWQKYSHCDIGTA